MKDIIFFISIVMICGFLALLLELSDSMQVENTIRKIKNERLNK